MKKALLATVVLAISSCASPSGTVDTTPDTTSTSAASGATTTVGQSESTTTAPGSETSTTSDRPRAPDFTLELGDGGTFTLSEGAKPVYMVFWAEW